jgi:DNA-binding MarR family transcriptional regulator
MKPNAAELRAMFEHESLGAPERAIGFVLWRLFHQYQRAIDRALEPLDLTNLQFTVLTLVAWSAKSGATVSQVELSRSSEIHKMQLSNILKTLEQKGLVRRTPSDLDTRAKDVELTRAGLMKVRKGLPIAIDVQRQLFGEAGMPGGELLSTLAGTLEMMESGAEPERS